jgi:hypothetical protein
MQIMVLVRIVVGSTGEDDVKSNIKIAVIDVSIEA